MKISPSPGYAFIIEEKSKNQTAAGIQLVEKNINSIGTIYSVNNEGGGFFYELFIRHFCKDNEPRYKAGDRVIYSQYLSEDKYIEDENGKEIKDIRLLPIHAIQAIIYA